MDISSIDTKATEFTEEELTAMGDILIKAKEIENDPILLKLVQNHMDKKVKSIKSVKDLRKKAQELALAPDTQDNAE
jgi:hypothetical protein